MPNGGVKKESFQAMDTDSKMDVLFDQQSEIIEHVKNFENGLPCSDRNDTCETRFKGIERSQNRMLGGLALVVVVIPLAITLLQLYG